MVTSQFGRTTGVRHGIPIVSLTDPARLDILPLIAGSLAGVRPGRVPLALYSFGSDPTEAPSAGSAPDEDAAETEQITRVLGALRGELGRETGGRIRFPRYRLVRWLLAQRLGDDDADRDRALFQLLRQRDQTRRSESTGGDPPDLGGTAANLVVWVLRQLAPPAWFRLKVNGRLPGRIGAEFRWLRRQAYRARNGPDTVLGFAEQLCTPARDRTIYENALKLLVAAFLEDLRNGYRRRPWRLRAIRRTAYAVALLDGVSETNGGFQLLDLLNDVRNETTTFDPLLVIASGATSPPRLRDCDLLDPARPVMPDTCLRAYEDWSLRLAGDSRESQPTAWYLSVVIPNVIPRPPVADLARTDTPAVRDYLTSRSAVERARRFTISPAPIWSRRSAVRTIGVLAAAAVGLAVFLPLHSTWQADARWRALHCGRGHSDPDAGSLRSVGRECVGLSEDGYVFPAPGGKLAAVQKRIYQLNHSAQILHAQYPQRPYVTVVYLEVMTSSTPTAPDLTSELQQLEGVAAAQNLQLQKPDNAEPIIRVVIANAGDNMGAASTVAQLVARRRPGAAPVVGVLGLDETTQSTLDAIHTLTLAGIPTVGATLSADVLASTSPMYFQVSPPNSREASVAAAFAKAVLLAHGGVAPQVRILYSADSHDIYSQDLAQDAMTDFQAKNVGFKATLQPFRPGRDTSNVSDSVPTAYAVGRQDVCRYPGIIFFAGRQQDFAQVLLGASSDCASSPDIIGDDDVARYAATVAVNRSTFPPIAFYSLSFTNPERCNNTSLLYRQMAQLFPRNCQDGIYASLEGSSAVAYDTVQVVTEAVRKLGGQNIPIGPEAVWGELNQGDFITNGESGSINFGDKPPNNRIPVGKFVAILRTSTSGQPSLQYSCAQKGAATNPSWCPTDRPGQ